MRSFLACVLLALGFGLFGSAAGTRAGGGWWAWPWRNPQPPCPCCPDDYGRKPLPHCPPRVCSKAPDDYHPKPLPCVAPVKCFGKDDYCPKPCGIWLPPCYPPWYICAPADECGCSKALCPNAPGQH
jgi:hypothetical protein